MLRGEGRVTVSRRGSSVVLCRLSGVIEPVHVEWSKAELERQLAVGPTTLFVDASRLTALSGPAGRALAAALSNWLEPPRGPLRAVHVLVDASSRVASLEALGPRLHRWTETEPFLRMLHEQSG